VAIVIAFNRPNDLQARVGALLLAWTGARALVFYSTTPGLEPAVRALPLPLALLVSAPRIIPGWALLLTFAQSSLVRCSVPHGSGVLCGFRGLW
jgi:hypothetical protein